MARYFVEHLHHFRCSGCSLWWTIGDFHLMDATQVYCPHCGRLQAAKEGKSIVRDRLEFQTTKREEDS